MSDGQREFDGANEAACAGLSNLTDAELAQFARAILSVGRLIARLPRDLPPELEPATQFRAPRPE